jgi:hypothetical protein
MLSPEEILKLPAGTCVFINPAYANQKEASIPLKLKIHIGDSETKRRAYGKEKFSSVIQILKKKTEKPKITNNDIQKRINALNTFIPSIAKQTEDKKEQAKVDIQGIEDKLRSLE